MIKVIPSIKSERYREWPFRCFFPDFLNLWNRIAQKYGVASRDIFFELGRRQVICRSEDLIIEVAQEIVPIGRDIK